MKRAGDYRIRNARETDRGRLDRLWTEFLEEQARQDPRFVLADDARQRWNNDFSEWIASRVYGLFVVETEANALIGFASVHLWYPAPIYRPELEAYLDEIYVAPDWRRKGVATSLLEVVREWAQARDACRMRLGVLGANETGLAFWEMAGARLFFQTLLIDI